MISFKAKEKLYWEQEISLVDNFWLSTCSCCLVPYL